MGLCLWVLPLYCVAASYAQAGVGEVCYTDDDCQQGTCCGIPTGELWVSRRRQVDPNFLLTPLPPVITTTQKAGTCKPYKGENETCNILYDKQMGNCPCGGDLACFSFEVADGTTEIVNPWIQSRPGYSRWNQCWPENRIKAYQSPPDLQPGA